jgi:hypothetical protein
LFPEPKKKKRKKEDTQNKTQKFKNLIAKTGQRRGKET